MTTVEQKLEGLLDREAIRNLSELYSDAVWRKDAAAVAALFTEDGVLNSEGTGATTSRHIFRGRAEILKTYRELGLFGSPRPFCHQVVIYEIGADRAKGRSYMELRLGDDNMDYWSSNVYEDEYQKMDGEWKFSTRSGVMFTHRPAIRAYGASTPTNT
jgi:hypothetical protein